MYAARASAVLQCRQGVIIDRKFSRGSLDRCARRQETLDQLEEFVADESLGLIQEAIRAAVLRKHQSFQSVIRVIGANARVSEK